jgi:hypothetical protein
MVRKLARCLSGVLTAATSVRLRLHFGPPNRDLEWHRRDRRRELAGAACLAGALLAGALLGALASPWVR